MRKEENLNERELLCEVSNGNVVAFSKLFKLHWVHLFNYLKKTTKSAEIAEDLVADVFLKIWTNRVSLMDVHHFDAFLMTIARNKAMDFFRTSAKNMKLQEVLSEKMEYNVEKSADHLLLDKETKAILEKAVQQLSSQRRTVFVLSKEEGLSHKEIAERLNLSHQTVKNTLNAALKSIREYLKDNQIDLFVSWVIIVNFLR